MTENTRSMARVVRVDSIHPIDGADAIEVAKIGGWSVVTKKSDFKPGDPAIYFEIDSFLPEGNPGWQFLVDKSSRMFDGRRGHVLRTIRLRGQLSQGLLLPPTGIIQDDSYIGTDVSELLGITKYEPPVPASLAGVARSSFPSCVPKTDQERIQNLAVELAAWKDDGALWEVTEKLEGMSCTFAWLSGELHVCSRNLDLMDAEGNTLWAAARALGLPGKLAARYPDRDIALQGEMVGFGIQGNIYGLRDQQFFLFDVFDVDEARYLSTDEREDLARLMGVAHAPVVGSFVLGEGVSMDALLRMADGASALKVGQLREGIVLKRHDGKASFKAISNKYLLGQKQ